MGKNNTELLKIAQKHLGEGGAKFRKFCGLPSGAAWCNAFVDYIAYDGGDSSLFFDGKRPTYCPTSIKWAQKNLAQIPLYLALPMDLIYFDWERNGVPNHIGFVRGRKSTSEIYTIEGNTNGGRVAQKTRPSKYVQGVFRPHFKGSFKLQKLTVDGECGYNTIAGLQKALGGLEIDADMGIKTVKRLQQVCGVKQDGSWGPATSRAAQKLFGLKGKEIDGAFGPKSVRKMQEWINNKCYKTTATAPAKPTTPAPAPKPSAPVTTAKLKSYRIDVDLTNQICTVYGVYTDGTTKPIMSEFVSTARKGKTTPVGNWKIQGASGGRKAKLRTAKMSSGKTYAEFLVRFHNGKCMHTVPYKKRQTTGHVNKTEFNKLGTPRSAGCVRMCWKMAKYIYTNCPNGTPVRVFKGKAGAYPMGKPKKYTATTDIDPTYKK